MSIYDAALAALKANIVLLKRKHNLGSHAELARRAGVSRAAARSISSRDSRRIPQLDVLCKVADALKSHPSALLEPPPAEPEIQDWIDVQKATMPRRGQYHPLVSNGDGPRLTSLTAAEVLEFIRDPNKVIQVALSFVKSTLPTLDIDVGVAQQQGNFRWHITCQAPPVQEAFDVRLQQSQYGSRIQVDFATERSPTTGYVRSVNGRWLIDEFDGGTLVTLGVAVVIKLQNEGEERHLKAFEDAFEELVKMTLNALKLRT